MTKVRPTLFIGLGGTGMEIALRIRRRILSHAWGSYDNPVRLANLTEFPLAQFIQFDLDTNAALETSKTGTDSLAEKVKFADEERIVFPFDLDKYFRTDDYLNRYPHIASWFPWTRNRVLELGIDPSNGTGQLRWLSRLYFFDKYQELKNSIQKKINLLLADVGNRAKLERLGLEVEPESLRLVVIASTAGGTGSGSFIDMGYLAKWLAQQQRAKAKVDLMLMLPTAFSVSGKTRTEANTYAALMELETCMSQEIQFVNRWSSSETPHLPSTPYDDVFLFDNGNLAMKKMAKVADLWDMVADILFEDFSSPVIAERRSTFRTVKLQYRYYPFNLPVDCKKYGSMKMSYSKAYSAFGQSIIESQEKQAGQEIPHNQENDNSLIKMLEQMSSSERMDLFINCLEMAMPWVEANLEGDWRINPDQYVCIIGVADARLFEQKFSNEFRSAIPVRSGITAHHIWFYETGVPGKLTCYVELSGIPLTALRQLPMWRESYDDESKKIPVHIHKDRTLFVHPLAPSAATLDRMSEDFKLFIQGIALGVLKLRNDPEGPVYCIHCKGEILSLGNERLIRMDGLPGYIDFLRRQVIEALDQINTPAQYSGMIALYDFYAEQVYPPRLMRDDSGLDYLHDSFARVMCLKLVEEARNVLENKFPGAGNDMVIHLRDTLETWTDEIEGSLADVYEHEVGSAHMPKRIVKPEFFQNDRTGEHDESPAELKKCLECGERTQASSKFCPNCGNRFDQPSSIDNEPPPIG